MNDRIIYTESFASPEVDRREVLRYAGVRQFDDFSDELLDKCIFESKDKLQYKACFRVFDIEFCNGVIDLGFAKVRSASLTKRLDGCEKIVIFCATIGSDFDRLIAKYNILSPATAVMLQALGSERVEALCDVLCERISNDATKKGYSCKARFSPGYGDLPLDLQCEIFDALDCTRKIGVTLNEALFMKPTKSVTAIVGLKNVK